MHFNKTLIALAVSSSLFPLHAAQAEETAKTEQVDRVLAPVTATVDREVEVQARTELGKLTEYTPISGAIVEREELEHLNLVNNLLELGKRVPGFSMVRNMRIPDGGKNYTENRVDGLRVSSTSNTSLLDEVDGTNLERVEVITGPGSALYGSGALGGTISVTTRQPPKEFEAKLSQELGSWGFARTGGNVGKTTDDGRFGFLFNASTMDNDGWRKNIASGNDTAAEEHKDGVAFRTLLRASDSTKLTLGIDQLHYDYHLAGALPLNATEAAKLKDGIINGVSLRDVYWDRDWQPSVPGTDGQTDHTFKTFSANLQQLIGSRGELTLALSRRNDEGEDGGAAGSGGSRSVICDNVTVTCATYNTGAPTATNTIRKSDVVVKSARPMFRQEFDLAKSTLYLGMEFIDVESDTATYNNSYTAAQAQQGMWALGAMTATGQGSVATEKNETPFIHYEFSPIDKLRLHVGERFDKITYSVNDRTTANKDGEKTFKDSISKAGATYDLVKDHLLWLSRAETFNAPSSSSFLDSAATGTAGNVIGSNLNPEEGVTHEIGFRGQFSNIGLSYDIAIYHSDTKGFINTRDCTAAEATALNGGADCDIRENLGGLTAKGVESVFNWVANDWLDIGATYVNSQALYHDDNVGATAGMSYMYMPRERLNLRLGVKPAPKWRVELEYDHISSYFYDTANTLTYSRPDLFSLRASYRDKNWSFWLHALNLTDEKYTSRVGNSTIAGVSVVAAMAGQGNSGTYTPLTLRAGLSYKF
jgi:iron complex outermembrane receptor protein